MEDEVIEMVSPKGKHNPEGIANRHGYEGNASVVLGGQRVPVKRPRVRALDGKELLLKTYEVFQSDDILTRTVLERILVGVSVRNYVSMSDALGSSIELRATSRSTISRRFIEGTQKAFEELMSRILNDLDICALINDGVAIKEHMILVCLGIDGNKHIPGL